MEKYRVKLNKNHSAKPEQHIKGFLANSFGNGKIQTYTKEEAKKKAEMFGGEVVLANTLEVEIFAKVYLTKMEKHGDNTTLAHFHMEGLNVKFEKPAIERGGFASYFYLTLSKEGITPVDVPNISCGLSMEATIAEGFKTASTILQKGAFLGVHQKGGWVITNEDLHRRYLLIDILAKQNELLYAVRQLES